MDHKVHNLPNGVIVLPIIEERGWAIRPTTSKVVSLKCISRVGHTHSHKSLEILRKVFGERIEKGNRYTKDNLMHRTYEVLKKVI